MGTIATVRARFPIQQNEDFQKSIHVADLDGLAIDVSAYDGEAQLRAGFKDDAPTALGTFEVTLVPGAWVDALGNLGFDAVMQLDRVQTAALTLGQMPPGGDGRVDGFLDNGIERKCFVIGPAILIQSVTPDL